MPVKKILTGKSSGTTPPAIQKLINKLKADGIPVDEALDVESLNEFFLFEEKEIKITKKMWDNDWKLAGKDEDDNYEKRVDALLSVFKDPDDAEKHAEKKYNELPPQASHMVIYEGWQENLDKGLTHFGYKKGSHVTPMKTWDLRIGTTDRPESVDWMIRQCFKEPMVKKLFKVHRKPKPGENYNWVNSYLVMAPKRGHLYRLHVGTGQFEYFALAIKPGEVYIFRQSDLAYGREEYIQFEDSMAGPKGAYDMARFRKDEKDLGKNPDNASHFVKVGWGIQDIGLAYTQLELPFDESVNEADEWSDDVKTKWTPPKGLFTKSSNEIADVLHKESDDLDQAMSRLQFYINRAGKLLSPKVKADLETAKKLLQQKFA